MNFKIILLTVLLMSVCEASLGASEQNVGKEHNIEATCKGDISLPSQFVDYFSEYDDLDFINSALGDKGEGKLCQGQCYIVKKDINIYIYRAWNTTNNYSKYFSGWSFYKPDGLTSDYRKYYQICYQWSPLYVLSECTLKSGTEVVIGTGQSAKCSEFLIYDVYKYKQIYIKGASDNNLVNCKDSQSYFKWQE